MTLDLRDLEVFLAVVRRGSFSSAAGELLVSQPAVSERVRHLERVVGTRMFDRTTLGATLTPAGEQLLPFAQRCATLADEAVEVVRTSAHHPRLVIAVHSTFAPRVLPVVLGALANTPRRVAVRDAHSHEVETLVVDGVADFGFAIPAGARRGLRRVPLPADPVTCVVAPSHELARVRRPSLDALKGTILAVNAWGEGADAFLAQLRTAGVEDWRIRQCGDAATAVTLARDHGHVGFVARSSASSEIRAKRLRRLAIAGMPRWTVQVDLVHRTRDRGDAAIELVQRAFR
jgi:DNA-binding transcriptional LysR family regulator